MTSDSESSMRARESASSGLEGIIEDPLVFFRSIANGLSLNLSSKLEETFDSAVFETDSLFSFMLERMILGKGNQLGVYFSYSGDGKSYPRGRNVINNLMAKNVVETLRHGLPHGRQLTSFSLANDSFSFFGDYSRNMIMDLCLWENVEYARDGRTVMGDETLSLAIDQPSPGVFSLSNLNNRKFNDGDVRTIERDVGGNVRLAKGVYDYRTFVHRMLEHFAGVPKEKWHDSKVYSENNGLSTIASYVKMLFPESEAAELAKQMKLRMQGGFGSVPRLSLGIKQLPNPGTDLAGYIANGAPLLVEYLHQLGIMSPAEARDMVAKRVTNYIMHQTSFQRSPQEARQIIQALQV